MIIIIVIIIIIINNIIIIIKWFFMKQWVYSRVIKVFNKYENMIIGVAK